MFSLWKSYCLELFRSKPFNFCKIITTFYCNNCYLAYQKLTISRYLIIAYFVTRTDSFSRNFSVLGIFLLQQVLSLTNLRFLVLYYLHRTISNRRFRFTVRNLRFFPAKKRVSEKTTKKNVLRWTSRRSRASCPYVRRPRSRVDLSSRTRASVSGAVVRISDFARLRGNGLAGR